MPHSFANLIVHILFSTKGRRPWLKDPAVRRELYAYMGGILKAIGFTNWYLVRLVFEQSIVTGLLGFAIGTALTAIATRFVSDYVPQFVTLLRWQDIVLVLGTTLLMSLIAGALPVRRIAGVDPVEAFNR